MQIGREREDEREGEEREKSLCAGRERKRWAGRGNGGRWGWEVLDETPSPPCTAPTILRPGQGKRGVARHHTRLHRI